MAALERVKVLVLGDSGVGKSSLVHLLCHNQMLGNPSWTVGCSVDVRIHDYKEGTPEEKIYFIELWDIGGSVGSASSVKSTRLMFYNSVNGIILVHDLTNKKSSQNLYRWSLEALNRDVTPSSVLVTNGDYDREQFADNQIPLLVIGTKLDQIPETKRNEVLSRTAFLVEDFSAEEINLGLSINESPEKIKFLVFQDCTSPRYLAAGSSNAVKLSRFFDKVIEKRYYIRDGNQKVLTDQTCAKTFALAGCRGAAEAVLKNLGLDQASVILGGGNIFHAAIDGLPLGGHIEKGLLYVGSYVLQQSQVIPSFSEKKRMGSGFVKSFHYD